MSALRQKFPSSLKLSICGLRCIYGSRGEFIQTAKNSSGPAAARDPSILFLTYCSAPAQES